MESEPYGAVVVRFQTPELHPGHQYLLNAVQDRHRKMIVVLGMARTYVPTDKNPLDFATRKAMIERFCPNAIVTSVRDSRDDAMWSRRLDEALGFVVSDQHRTPVGAGEDSVVLYGSRDSFAPHYKGRHKVVELPAYDGSTSTDLRLEAVTKPSNTEDFRRGVIYCATTRPPLLYQAADVAIYDIRQQRLLFGRKHEDGGALRFVGGFVSSKDDSLESAARREAQEETGGIELGKVSYVGSHLVDDWRYRVGKDRIMTSLFFVEYIFGAAHGSDDMDETVWVNADYVRSGRLAAFEPGPTDDLRLVPEHLPLGRMLAKYMAERGL